MRIIGLLALFLCTCPVLTAQVGTPPLVLTDTANTARYVVSREVELYEDKSNRRIIDAVAALSATEFTPLQHPCCNFGYERNTLWLRFRVVNHSQADRFLLEVVNPFITRLTFFEIDAAGQVLRSDTTGAYFPFAHRSLRHRNFLFPVTLPPNDSTWIYLAVAPDYPLHLRILFWSQAERQSTQQRAEDILLTTFFAFCTLYLLLSAILISVTRQHFQWYYFGYVLVTTMFIPAHLGLGFRYVWPEVPALQFIIPAALNNLRLVLGIQFFRLYFDLPRKAPQLSRFIDVTIGIFLLTMLLQIVHEWFPLRFVGWVLTSFFGYLMFFSLGMLGWILREMVYKRRRQASWLFVVVALNFIGLSTTAMQYLGYGTLDLAARLLPFGTKTVTFFVPATVMAAFFLEMVLVFYFSLRQYIRLFEKNQRTQLQLARTKEQGLNALILGVENERRRIARDLHDSACVHLAAIKMKVHTLRERLPDPAFAVAVADIAEDLEETYREVRGISHDLMSKSLEKTDLLPALEDLVARIQQAKPGLVMQFYANAQLDHVGSLAKIHLYRVVQELLANVLKHAQATTVTLQILQDRGKILLTVEDDGIGFDPANVVSDGIGLANVGTRVKVLHGTMHLDTTPGRGTFVSIEVPENILLPNP